MNQVKMSKTAKKILQYVLMLVLTFMVMLPLLWMLIMSFKTNPQILSEPLSMPNSFNFDNYIRALNTLDLPRLFVNTGVIAIVTLIIELVITFMSSFVISRMHFKNKKLKQSLYIFLLVGLTISPFILLFPVYRLTILFKLTRTYTAVIIPYIATSISFNTLLFVGYLNTLPRELDEAAVIDGCGIFRLVTNILVPIAKPVIATIIIFNVLYIWNEYPFASTLIPEQSKYTLSLGASMFKGRYSVDYAGMVAASVMILAPQLLFFGIFQRYLVEGMTAGAVKG